MTVRVGRVYDERRYTDGTRVLVDRLWPRGVRRDDERIDEWLPDVAPSTELRRWYGHDGDKFHEFARRYRAELGDPEHDRAVTHLRVLSRKQTVMLVTATKDVAHSQASVLAESLNS